MSRITSLLSACMVGTVLFAVPASAVTFGLPTQLAGTSADAEPPQILSSRRSVFVIWHEFPSVNDQQPDVFIAVSKNRGRDFAAAINLSNSVGVSSASEEIAASQRRVFVVWNESDGTVSQILFTRSVDGGRTFEPPKNLSIAGGADNPRIAASGRDVYVAWQAEGVNGNPDIFFAESSDGGHSFDTEENISNNGGISEFRDAGLDQIAVSGRNVIITWRDDTTPAGDFEIFVARGR